jgi:argininosuccinate lyase
VSSSREPRLQPALRNSIDAVADRDFVAEMLFTIAMLGAHVSRIAEM